MYSNRHFFAIPFLVFSSFLPHLLHRHFQMMSFSSYFHPRSSLDASRIRHNDLKHQSQLQEYLPFSVGLVGIVTREDVYHAEGARFEPSLSTLFLIHSICPPSRKLQKAKGKVRRGQGLTTLPHNTMAQDSRSLTRRSLRLVSSKGRNCTFLYLYKRFLFCFFSVFLFTVWLAAPLTSWIYTCLKLNQQTNKYHSIGSLHLSDENIQLQDESNSAWGN